MGIRSRHAILWAAAATTTILAVQPQPAHAQAVSDQILSNVSAQTVGECSTIKISFNVRVQIVSHFPENSGRELHIRVDPLDGSNIFNDARESLRVPAGVPDLSSISFENDPSLGSSLSLFFGQQVNFAVEANTDPQVVVVRIAKSGDPNNCISADALPASSTGAPPPEMKADIPIPSGLYVVNFLSQPNEIGALSKDQLAVLGDVIIYDTAYEQDGQTWHRLRAGFFNTRAEALAASERYSVLFPDSWVAKVDSQERLQGVVTRRHGPSADMMATQSAPRAVLTAEQQQAMQANVAGAEEALRLNDPDRAIALLTEAMALPENDLTPRALELLGLARERKGQSAHAIAEYDVYLRRYPNGEAAGRVQQRLAALSSPSSGTPEALRPSSSGVAATAEAWRWDMRGSFSQFYFRDQSRVTTINATPTDPNADPDIQNNVSLNQLMTSADVTLVGGNDRNQITMRAAGSYSKNFDAGTDDRKSVSALYVDFNDKELGLSGRFGRQTRNSAGVFGRFDGALLGVQAKPRLRFNAVAGFPVRSSRNVYVDKQAYFYGFSADYGARNDKLQGTVYWFDQRAKGGLIDRRSVGGEVRYLNKKFNAFALVDYDIHFGEVDLALFTMNYTFPDKSSIGVTADYRRSPLLTTRNAMIGQFGANNLPITNLSDLLLIYTEAEIQQLAIDRSSIAKSVTLNYARPISEKLQVNFDVTASQFGGQPASGGVAAILASGTEYYYGAQVIGTGLLMNNDIYIFSIRGSDSARSRSYIFDLNARVPVMQNLKVSPRARYGFRDNKIDGSRYTQFQPTMRINYYPMRSAELELEFGANFTNQGAPSGSQLGPVKERSFIVNIGYRLDF